MSTERTITVKAADGTLTMAELKDFVEEFTEALCSAGGDAAAVLGSKPKARVSMRGGLKSVTVTVPGHA